MEPVVVVVTGVSGSGKSTIGAALASRLGWPFFDGDDLHPPANVDKMRRGIPLDDADRAPWLARLRDLIRDRVTAGEPAVLASSALKRRYRDLLRTDQVAFVFLDADRATLAARLAGRTGHYMPASLLDSQLATLEPPTPDEALIVDATRPVSELVDSIVPSLA